MNHVHECHRCAGGYVCDRATCERFGDGVTVSVFYVRRDTENAGMCPDCVTECTRERLRAAFASLADAILFVSAVRDAEGACVYPAAFSMARHIYNHSPWVFAHGRRTP